MLPKTRSGNCAAIIKALAEVVIQVTDKIEIRLRSADQSAIRRDIQLALSKLLLPPTPDRIDVIGACVEAAEHGRDGVILGSQLLS